VLTNITDMDSPLALAARIATALQAGAFLLGTAGFNRVVRRLEDPIHIRVRQAAIPVFRRLLLPMMLLSSAATGAAAWLQRQPAITAWIAFGCACAMLVITVAINVPVNRSILNWSPDTPPTSWRDQIVRWNIADAVRLALGVAAFFCMEASR
jgi:Domain of unknown function (DUF1772)